VYVKLYILHIIFRKSKETKQVNFLGYTIETYSYYYFFRIFREIFVDSDYWTPLENSEHDIVDCGANIGLATLYYKWLMPDAHIECFEPDPTSFVLLKKNIERNNLQNVRIHNKAVFDKEGSIEFYTSEDRPGSPKTSTLSERVGADDYKKVSVSAIDLSKYLEKRKVKLLKMDIEGSEYQVLLRMSEKGTLSNVEELHLEYHHNIPNQEHRLSDFFALFDKEGISYILEADMPTYKPPQAKQQDLLIKYRCAK